MKRENLRTLTFCCVLAFLLTGTAWVAASPQTGGNDTASLLDGGLIVTRAVPANWDVLRMTADCFTTERLTAIAQMLPGTVTATLSDGTTVEVPVAGEWTTNGIGWTCTADATALPEGVTDPRGLLGKVMVRSRRESGTLGRILVMGLNLLGGEGRFDIFCQVGGMDRMELWQVPADGSAAVLRSAREDVSGLSVKVDIDAWSAGDAGTWFALYYAETYSPGEERTACLFSSRLLTFETCKVTFYPNGGTLSGQEAYQTVLSDGVYTLETLPEDPVRTGWQFEGWYTAPLDGERVDISGPFRMDTTLYAHWSRLPGSPYSLSVSDGQELRRAYVPGLQDRMHSVITRLDLSPNYASPVYGHVFENPDGTYTTVDSINGRTAVVTTWDQDFRRIAQKELPEELPLFGGFFHGEAYNYIVYGQENPEEDDTLEVYRVVRYDGEFNRVSAAAVTDCFTIRPFEAGACRMAESGNHLVVHTSRLRYLTEDGIHHQSQLTIVLNTDTMTAENYLGRFQKNHVSHSFNQFVLYDGEDQVLLDHGDAGPRTVVLHKGGNPDYQSVDLFLIPGAKGDNYTGVTVGGLVRSDSRYFASINTVNQSAVAYARDKTHTLDSEERDAVLLSCGVSLDERSVRQDYLTNYYKTGVTATTPVVVKMNEDRFVILWEEFYRDPDSPQDPFLSQGVRYGVFDGNGDFLTDLTLLPQATLSKTCRPTAAGDRVVWYVDDWLDYNRSQIRVFYELYPLGEAPDDRPLVRAAHAEAGTVTGYVKGTPTESALYVCLFDGDGRFLRVGSAEAHEGSVRFSMPTDGGATARMFLLDGDLRPLCPAQTTDVWN